jgi:hypothetical protein
MTRDLERLGYVVSAAHIEYETPEQAMNRKLMELEQKAVWGTTLDAIPGTFIKGPAHITIGSDALNEDKTFISKQAAGQNPEKIGVVHDQDFAKSAEELYRSLLEQRNFVVEERPKMIDLTVSDLILDCIKALKNKGISLEDFKEIRKMFEVFVEYSK